MAGNPILPIADSQEERLESDPKVKDPIEHNQRVLLRIIFWAAAIAILIGIIVSLSWPSETGSANDQGRRTVPRTVHF